MNNDVGGEDASSVLYFLLPHHYLNCQLLSLSLLLQNPADTRIGIRIAYTKLSSDNLFRLFQPPLIIVSNAVQLEAFGQLPD